MIAEIAPQAAVITIVYLEHSMLLTKRPFAGWPHVKAQYPKYMTHLGPWSAEEVIEFLDDDYPSTITQRTGPAWRTIIERFIANNLEEISLSKDGEWSIIC